MFQFNWVLIRDVSYNTWSNWRHDGILAEGATHSPETLRQRETLKFEIKGPETRSCQDIDFFKVRNFIGSDWHWFQIWSEKTLESSNQVKVRQKIRSINPGWSSSIIQEERNNPLVGNHHRYTNFCWLAILWQHLINYLQIKFQLSNTVL